MIVRLYPKIDINKIWDYVEHELKEEPSKTMTRSMRPKQKA